MYHITHIKRFLAFTLMLGAALTILAVGITVNAQEEATTLSLDVAQDMTRFSFDEASIHENGMPTGGNAFISHGYIYPGGTLGDSLGVLENGEPEFPDLVIGEWTCWGYFINDGPMTATGSWVILTQVFNLGNDIGEDMLVTHGFELADLDKVVERAISGGTGQYSTARGVAVQQTLGLNASGAPSIRVEFRVED